MKKCLSLLFFTFFISAMDAQRKVLLALLQGEIVARQENEEFGQTGSTNVYYDSDTKSITARNYRNRKDGQGEKTTYVIKFLTDNSFSIKTCESLPNGMMRERGEAEANPQIVAQLKEAISNYEKSKSLN